MTLLFLFSLFYLIGNPVLIWWHVTYVRTTVYPLSNISSASNTAGMQQQFIGITIIGCILICVNAVFGSQSLILLLALKSKISTRSRKIIFWIVLSIAIAWFLFGTFVQFLSPFVTSTLMWKHTYKGACRGMDTRVYLDSAQGQPARNVEFVDMASGPDYDRRVKYTMRMEPDPSAVWGFIEDGVYNFTITPNNYESDFVPVWDQITYNLGAKTFEVLEKNKSILRGQFGLGKNFSIPALNMRGDLSAYAKGCVFDPTAEIYDYSVGSGGEEKGDGPVMKTVQFKICDRLQVCTDKRLADMTAVPVGLLILQRAGRGMACCKGKYMPGIEGRG